MTISFAPENFCLYGNCDAPQWVVSCSNGYVTPNPPVQGDNSGALYLNYTFSFTVADTGADVNMNGSTSDVVCNVTATYANPDISMERTSQVTLALAAAVQAVIDPAAPTFTWVPGSAPITVDLTANASTCTGTCTYSWVLSGCPGYDLFIPAKTVNKTGVDVSFSVGYYSPGPEDILLQENIGNPFNCTVELTVDNGVDTPSVTTTLLTST